MTAAEIVDNGLEYLVLFGPYLLIFFAISFAYKLIDLMFYAMGKYRDRR